VAHVVAAAPVGPRADPAAVHEDLVAEENLIALCPNTHTAVDSAPDVYSAVILRGWKRDHARRVDEMFGVARFETREQARMFVEPLLAQNREPWRLYGPESESASHPLSEAHEVWLRRVAETVLPNNSRIWRALEANAGLLRADEATLPALFALHAEAFAARHLTGEFDPAAPRFPAGMDRVFADA
jgi:hypothetical protein